MAMADETKCRCGCRSVACGCHVGLLWFMAWLFTLGLLHLSFWKGVAALFIWPYYIGTFFSAR
jgi:hypothetical protein